MCRKSFHHQKKYHQAKYGHWMAGNMGKWGRHKRFQFRNYPPVNVQELDDRYELFLFAPGLSKEDFKIALKENYMTIAVDKKEEEEIEEGAFWKRKEFSQTGFKRKFELNEKIDLNSIKAKYDNGILQLTLAKLEGEETIRKDIFVA